jgi:hypothetical protein
MAISVLRCSLVGKPAPCTTSGYGPDRDRDWCVPDWGRDGNRGQKQAIHARPTLACFEFPTLAILRDDWGF